STYSSGSHANPDPFYPASYWYWSFEQFAVADQPGTWRYEIVFEGKTYVHEFGVVASAAEVPTSTPTSAPGATPTPLACAGDCDGDGVISIAELIRAVGIALGTVPLDACVAADPLSDGRVTIAELVRCVGSAIGNCRGATPRPPVEAAGQPLGNVKAAVHVLHLDVAEVEIGGAHRARARRVSPRTRFLPVST